MNDEILDPSPSRSTLRSYLRILRRQWWVPLIVTIAAVAAAVVYTERATPEYSASMKIVIGQGQALFGADASGAFQPFTQTMTDLLRSNVVARQTIRLRGLDDSPQELLDRVSVTTNPDTSVLQVSVRSTDRAEAISTLDAMGGVFVSLIDENLSQRDAQDPSGATGSVGALSPDAAARAAAVSATVFDPAHGDPDPVSPHGKRSIIFALLLGLLAGVLLAFLRDALSNNIRGDHEAADALGTAILASLPPGALGTRPSEIAFLPPRLAQRVSESVQLMAASLRYAGSELADGGVVVVTSARPGDGKTSVVAFLSAALADAGASVAAVEADLHRPALHRMLGLEPTDVGLTDVLSGRARIEDALIDVNLPASEAHAVAASRGGFPGGMAPRPPRLEFLGAGTRHRAPAELLTLGSAGAALTALRELDEWVIVDTPPVLLSGDPFPLLRLADHVIVVCRAGQTTRDEAQAVRTRLASVGVKHHSVVMTESSDAVHRSYGYSTAGVAPDTGDRRGGSGRRRLRGRLRSDRPSN